MGLSMNDSALHQIAFHQTRQPLISIPKRSIRKDAFAMFESALTHYIGDIPALMKSGAANSQQVVVEPMQLPLPPRDPAKFLLKAQQPPNLLPSAAAMRGRSEEFWRDPRVCCFCNDSGDSESADSLFTQDGTKVKIEEGDMADGVGYTYSPGSVAIAPSGRLLPVSPKTPGLWCHTTCALWSGETYEDSNGQVFKVPQAKSRGHVISCSGCGQRGASIGCAGPGCKLSFHFLCANATAGVFAANRSYYCKDHVPYMEKKMHEPLELELDGGDHRPLFVFHNERKLTEVRTGPLPLCTTTGTKPEMIEGVIRLGALVVHSLGEISQSSDLYHTKDYIYPLNYTATRIFWSASVERTRTLYILRVTAGDKGPLFSIRSADNEHFGLQGGDLNAVVKELYARVLAVNRKYFKSVEDDKGSNACLPTVRGLKWKEQGTMMSVDDARVYGINGPHFFGLGIPEVRLALERSNGAAALVVPITPRSKPYQFSQRLPTEEQITVVQRRRAAEAALKDLVSTSGCARIDGLDAIEKSTGAGRITRALVESSKTSEADAMPAPAKRAVSSQSTQKRGNKRMKNGGEGQGENHETAYRLLKSLPTEQRLQPLRSHIHGWGLFTKIDIEKDEMVIEYAGELIRNSVTDRREADYERRGIGSCYMFRVDQDTIVDATLHGCMARFMNHCCIPNAYAKTITVDNLDPNQENRDRRGFEIKIKKIVIFAKARIPAGTEVVYDYQFPIEDGGLKCTCGHPQCIGRMN